MTWRFLTEPANCNTPACYRRRLVTAEGKPIPIPTLLGGPDPSGLVCVGYTGAFQSRLSKLIAAIQTCSGHPAGNLWRYLCDFTQLQRVFPGCRLQYSFTATTTEAEAEILEGDAVKEYVIRFGQLPL